MATPNYGNGMQQPGMQQQQMQQQQGYPPQGGMPPPQGAVPPPKAVRRGTSKAVPIVMSAGLAVGVFCGLLFGLGTGNDGAIAATGPRIDPTATTTDVPDVLKAPSAADGTAKKVDSTAPAAPPPPPPPAVAAAPAAGSDAGSAAPVVAAAGSAVAPAPAATGSAAGSAAPAVAAAPAPAGGAIASDAKIKFEVTPATATDVKFTIDGKDYAPESAIAMNGAATKTIDVVVRANGFHEFEQKPSIGPGMTIVKVELVKRVSNGGGNARPTWTGTQTIPAGGSPKPATPTQPKSQPKPKGKSSGLIDI
jgi:hypothetical protein